ncbi:hypothetical protein K501DRAFT_272999 [Backusella circina FSU 941]|nr:hypothetical protein K501DRAFT_272999 [Backusella circina FSU 941]
MYSMSNIYRNSRDSNDKVQSGSEPGSGSRSNQPARYGLTSQQLQLQEARKQGQSNQHETQQLPAIYTDYSLLSTVHSEKHHLLDFKTNNKESNYDIYRNNKIQQKHQTNESVDNQPSTSSTTEGADIPLIAPVGGAVRNKQMLFKKRTKQIYLEKEDNGELKKHSFTGTYEGGQQSDYFFFFFKRQWFQGGIYGPPV